MKTVWILAWLASLASTASSTTSSSSDSAVRTLHHADTSQRSLKKRQLDFEGGGGGVNQYVNGDEADYSDDDTEDRVEERRDDWNTVRSVFHLLIQLEYFCLSALLWYLSWCHAVETQFY